MYRQTVEYDACSRVVKRREAVGDTYTRYDTGYTYDIENRPTEIAHGDTVKSVYDYGKLDRVESVTLKRGTTEFKKTFTYQAGGYGGASTTATVEKIDQPGHAYQYTVRGGLTAERHNGVKTTYEYDGLGQLKRVNDEGRGTSTAYTYDQGGNILSKAEYPYAARGRKLGEATRTVAYAYGDAGWKDVLTAYDGVAIESDAIGNVVDDGTWRYTWRMGRQLLRMASPAEYIWYAYDADGLRVRKESESRGVTEYTLSDGRVAHQRRGTQEMHFWYGSRRNPVMATYNGKDYGYVYNRQGDVVALVDVENGFAEVVTYAYDAWGKQLSCTGTMAETLGRENPFRYRGYVYDEETGLYYLKSRYYNPEWGRFLSADSVLGRRGDLLEHNLFAYCKNEPVGRYDPNGRTAAACADGWGWSPEQISKPKNPSSGSGKSGGSGSSSTGTKVPDVVEDRLNADFGEGNWNVESQTSIYVVRSTASEKAYIYEGTKYVVNGKDYYYALGSVWEGSESEDWMKNNEVVILFDPMTPTNRDNYDVPTEYDKITISAKYRDSDYYKGENLKILLDLIDSIREKFSEGTSTSEICKMPSPNFYSYENLETPDVKYQMKMYSGGTYVFVDVEIDRSASGGSGYRFRNPSNGD